jgi:hypothetical protein
MIPLYLLPSLILAALCCGCGGSLKERELPAAPSEALRANIRTVAIICEQNPRLEMRKAQDKGSAATEGAIGGFLSGAGAGGHGGGDFAGAAQVLVWIIAIPIGTVSGAVEGAIEGVPREQIERADLELRKAADEVDVSSLLRGRLLEEAQRNTRYVLRTPLPSSDEQDCTARYKKLAQEGVDTVLEVSILSMGLGGNREPNPPLQLVIRARVRLVQAIDGRELYAYPWVSTYGSHRFTEWAENHAQPFRSGIERVTGLAARGIIEELFLVHRP